MQATLSKVKMGYHNSIYSKKQIFLVVAVFLALKGCAPNPLEKVRSAFAPFVDDTSNLQLTDVSEHPKAICGLVKLSGVSFEAGLRRFIFLKKENVSVVESYDLAAGATSLKLRQQMNSDIDNHVASLNVDRMLKDLPELSRQELSKVIFDSMFSDNCSEK